MCDYSTKLIAWLDQELEPKETAEVQQHLANCDECRASLTKYEQISQAFDDYCHAIVTASPSTHGHRRWVPILSAAAAVLVVAATAAIFLRSRVQPLNVTPASPVPSITATHGASPPDVPELPRPTGIARKSPLGHRMISPVSAQPVNWVPPQPAVQVAIPADSMFPPGAVPEGISFVADVNFAPDGSARQMRLRPRMTAIERSVSQP